MDAPTIPGPDAGRFLRALGGDGPFLFQTYASDKDDKRPGQVVCKVGTLAAHGPALAKANGLRASVAVLANENDGSRKRRTGNIRSVRALFVDLDGAPLAPVESAPLAPHIVTETSPGRFHAFWRVTGCPLADFVRVQRALAERFNADPTMADVTRCVRVPGFMHNKGEPFPSRVLTLREAAPIAYADFLRAFDMEPLPTVSPPQKLGRIAAGKRNPELFKLAKAGSRKAIPEQEELARLLTVNAERCDPPLSADEVRGIVANAYAQEVTGYAAIPFACMDAPAFRTLDADAVRVLLLAYRRYDGRNNGRITLAWSECKEAWPHGGDGERCRAFERARARAVASGLLSVAMPAKQPKKGGSKPEAARFRLRHVIGSAREPYQAAA